MISASSQRPSIPVTARPPPPATGGAGGTNGGAAGLDDGAGALDGGGPDGGGGALEGVGVGGGGGGGGGLDGDGFAVAVGDGPRTCMPTPTPPVANGPAAKASGRPGPVRAARPTGPVARPTARLSKTTIRATTRTPRERRPARADGTSHQWTLPRPAPPLPAFSKPPPTTRSLPRRSWSQTVLQQQFPAKVGGGVAREVDGAARVWGLRSSLVRLVCARDGISHRRRRKGIET